MLFPTDPNKRPELWPVFAAKVEASLISFVVRAGERLSDEDRQAPIVESADEIVKSFRSADIVRFGASRGSAIGPFFAFYLEAETARLAEYAIDSGIQVASEEAIQEALQSVAINLFFERRDVTHIILPITLPKWACAEWQASVLGTGTILSRKMPAL